MARQAQGLDLDRVAGELHLSPTMIESLERDDYQSLPGQVFIVGYIRKYARLVGLAPEPLLAAYQGDSPPIEPLRASAVPRAERRIGNGHLVIRLASAGLLILLAALAFLLWKTQQPGTSGESFKPGTEQEVDGSARPESTSQSRATIGPADTDPSAGPAREETSTAESSEVIGEPAGSTSGAGTDKVSVSTAQVVEVPAAVNEEGDELDAKYKEIVINFDGTSWVDIRDSERKYMLFGEMKKGDSRVLEGKPPYSVIIGNVAAVQISVGGEAFDLSAISKGNVARFTLDPGKEQEPRAEGQRSASSALDPIP